MAFHKEDKNYKCLNFNNVVINRNDRVDRYNYKSPTETGNFAISIHRSSEIGSSENVYNYSEGSQVFKSSTQYKQFIMLCDNQIKNSKKGTFTYALCRKSDFDNFI